MDLKDLRKQFSSKDNESKTAFDKLCRHLDIDKASKEYGNKFVELLNDVIEECLNDEESFQEELKK